jgi:hypothetical protein
LILDAPWPPDLDPETVPFRVRTVTILRRKGIWDDMTRLDEISEADLLSWMAAGVKTVADLRDTGNAAVATHHAGAPERRRLAAELLRIADGLRQLAGESWTAQVWWRDPRFRDLLQRGDATVREICLNGSPEEQLHLWESLPDLEARMQRFAALPLREAVAGYVEAISCQHGIRLNVLLAHTGLNGRDPIMGREASAMLGVSPQRVQQISAQLNQNRDRATPPDGIWMPQVNAAVVARLARRVHGEGNVDSPVLWAVTRQVPALSGGLRGLGAVSGETRCGCVAPTLSNIRDGHQVR